MSATESPAVGSPGDPTPPTEWKPEPRQWTIKDLFTAPMLAFKPKCMVISALTLIALGAWGLFEHEIWALYNNGERLWAYVAAAVWVAVAAVIYSIGASLVAVYMRADLLDDEFLSLREALTQFRGRLAPALLVPLFLLGLLLAVNVLLIWVPEAVCSIPYAGSLLYAVLYPVGYFLAIFAVLLLIAVCLSAFVFPGIIAIRKHGWFDNVVDTIEAVGTKPHVLVASLVLTLIMVLVAHGIGTGAMDYLQAPSRNDLLFGAQELPQAEMRAGQIRGDVAHYVSPVHHAENIARLLLPRPAAAVLPISSSELPTEDAGPYGTHPLWQESDGSITSGQNRWYHWCTGLITGIWETLIWALILGYCLNLLIGGGMLTYLLVREDDYWDDEDLEDLDKLAKELEEEAKRDEAAGAPAGTPATGTPVPPATPPAPPAPPAAPAT